MKPNKIKVLSTALAAVILLSACNLIAPQATPTQDAQSAQATINAAVTQAMESIARQLTSTAAALPTVAATSHQRTHAGFNCHCLRGHFADGHSTYCNADTTHCQTQTDCHSDPL